LKEPKTKKPGRENGPIVNAFLDGEATGIIAWNEYHGVAVTGFLNLSGSGSVR
jgi:hypothetical protein